MKKYILPIVLSLGLIGCSRGNTDKNYNQVPTEQSSSQRANRSPEDEYLGFKIDSTTHKVPVFSYTVKKGDNIFKILSNELKGSKTFSRAPAYLTNNFNNISMLGDSTDSYEFDQCYVFLETNPILVDRLGEDCAGFTVGEKISVPDLNGDGRIEGHKSKKVGNLTFTGELYNRTGADPKLNPRSRWFKYRKSLRFEPVE